MGIKKNFLYNSILTSAGYIFPLITFPYVSRVLGVSNIGICNFVDSVISYFLLFAMMGIRTIGTREIAKYQGDRARMSEVFCNLLSLNAVFVLISGLVLVICINTVPQFVEYKRLLYIGGVKIISTFMLVDWLFSGVEDFKYITYRSILIRTIYVISVFVFVREEDDYVIYYVLLISAEVINSIINSIYARRYISLNFRAVNPVKYLRSSLVLGSYTFLTSMYTSFNITYLGFVASTDEVGYYTTATKLHSIVIALFTAFTGVMIPRMSNIMSKGNTEEVSQKIGMSVSILYFISFPVIIIGMLFAPEIISIIAGGGYERASIPFQIVMPLVFIIGLEQVLIMQILVPMGKDKEILINSFVGACVGVIANLLLVKSYGCIGASLVWCMSEISVLMMAYHFVRKTTVKPPIWKKLFGNLLYSVIPIGICLLVRLTNINGIIQLVIGSIIVAVYYFVLYTIVLKDETVLTLLPKWIKRI